MERFSEPEKEFIASFKALLVRYNITIEVSKSGTGHFIIFRNNGKNRKEEIYLGTGEIFMETGYTEVEIE